MLILGIDPSGNFDEGKGTTGFCAYNTLTNHAVLSDLKAEKYTSRSEYWQDIVNKISLYCPDIVVCEDYFLYNNKSMKASSQSNSALETVRLIGIIEYVCYSRHISIQFQRATIKSRWTEEILVNTKVLTLDNKRYYYNGVMTNDHQRDALKHTLNYIRYGLPKYKGGIK